MSFVPLLPLLFTLAVGAETPLDLLHATADNYRNLESYEISGHLATTIPGTTWQNRTKTQVAAAGSKFVPPGSPVSLFPQTILFSTFEFINLKDEKDSVHPKFEGLFMPQGWANFDSLDLNIKSVKRLQSQTVKVENNEVPCEILQVLYDDPLLHRVGIDTVEYWIDPLRYLVLQEKFATIDSLRNKRLDWIFTVDSIKINQPPPQWLVDLSRDHPMVQARKEWIGRPAPKFSLIDVDGHRISWSQWKGKVVLLDFWATWCGPCKEEMPTIEKLRAEYQSKGVEVWGVAGDPAPTAKKWLNDHHRTLPTLIDANHSMFKSFEIEGIPALVIIGRDGKIASYIVGLQPEGTLRSALDQAVQLTGR